ncbi:hypothetical protein ACHAW5_009610 [Stephanodiscus triporus]|uniref:Peptidase S59 domain-containing protein n=1 Tax=Stephanodiscus triporus TaxID=2934178 RepID=A0ABD3NS71_9STRA
MFGQTPATSPFGAPAAPFGAPAPAPFGGFGQPSSQQAPAAGGFGSSASVGFGGVSSAGGFGQPAVGQASTSLFGAPATTATAGTFGQPSASAPSAFGQPSSTTTTTSIGGFGVPQQGGGGGFGAPVASGGMFGGGGVSAAPAPALFGGGSSTASSAFGAKPAGGGLFGGGAPAPSGGLFGSAPAARGLFGAASPSPPPFGGAAPSALFGSSSSSSAFGAQAAPAFGTAPVGAFGAAPAAGGFGQPQQQGQTGTTVAQYQTTMKQDGTSTIVLQAITAMPQYEQKSFEELRLEDYMAGNKGTQGQAAPAPSAFGGFGAAPTPAFGQPATAPAFGAAPAPSTGGLFGGGAPAPAPTGGLFSSFGSPSPAPAFGQPASAPAFGASAAPPAGGLFGSAPAPALTGGGLFGAAPAPAFGQPSPAPAFGVPAPAAGGLFGSAPAPAFGAAPQPAPSFGAAPAPAFGGGGLFGAPAPAPAAGGLFGSTPAPAAGGLFGSPAPAPSLFGQPAPAPAMGGLFGAPTPAKPGGLGLFGSTPAPATGGLFGQTPAPSTGGLFGHAPAPAPVGLYGYPAVPTVPMPPPPSAEALLAQQLATVENQKKQMELLEAWRGNLPSGSKVVPTSQYDSDSGSDWNGGGVSLATSSSALLSYRAAPRSAAKIRPRGYTPTKQSPAAMLGMKTGSPILSPNRFVGSTTKALFIKPNSLTPKPKTRLLLTNGAFNGSSAGALENGNYESPRAPSFASINGSQTKPTNSVSPQQTPRAAGSPSTPAEDFYRQVVDSARGPSSFSPLQANNPFVPKLTKPGYNVYPSIAELEAMSEADLAAVTGFKVERPQYGSVAWDGAVDVRGVDIDSVVVIERKNVSVYDEAEANGEKPQQGSKLNRPAVITMYDVYPKEGAESSAEAKDKLQRKIEKSTKKMGAELISFDSESGVWTFRVGHFSRYGLDDSDDDSDNDIESTPLLETSDDEQESVIPTNQTNELGGASRMHAPIDEDESTSAHTDNMSSTEISDHSETEDDGYQELNEIVCAAEEAYAMMTEEVLAECEEEVTMFEPMAVEETKILFPDEGADELTLPVTQPLKPAGSIPSTGICNRLAEKCGLNKASSSNVDFGMRMRRSFRVGWRPDGSLIQIKPSSSGAQVLVQSRPDISLSSDNSDKKLSAILSLMQTHKKHCVKATDSEFDAPTFTLPRSIGSGNDALISALEDYSLSSAMCPLSSPTNKIVSNAFSLLVCLYGGDKTLHSTLNQSRRLEAVSTWLKGVVSSDTKRAIAAAQSSSSDVYGSIFAALSGGDVATASSLALDIGCPPFLRYSVGNVAQQWRPTIHPNLHLRIFSLASGRIDTERKIYKSESDSYNIDWRRRFGMYLWSCSHSQDDQASVSSIVKQYSSDVSAGLAPPATPLYCDNSSNATQQCILYQVLNHYEDLNMPLADIIAPSSHSQCKHDFSSSFHLCATLTALSRSKFSHYQEHLVIDSVISQLIGGGYWEWAVYASLCFIGNETVSECSASARLLRAKNIIARFYVPSIDPLAESRRSFLQNIGIPPEWFLEAHAYRCASEGDVFGMLDNLMRFSAIDSMTVLERTVIPHMILEGKESRKQLCQILHSLRSKITDDTADCWNKPNGCGMFYQFLELWIQVEKLSNMHLNQVQTSDVNIDHLLDIAANMETMISMSAANALKKSSIPPTLVRYGFTRTPLGIILVEMDRLLSNLRVQLLAIGNGSHELPARSLDLDCQMSLNCSSQLTFSLSPDGLYGESVIRRLCGFKTMG